MGGHGEVRLRCRVAGARCMLKQSSLRAAGRARFGIGALTTLLIFASIESAAGTANYTYDALGRLAGVTFTDGSQIQYTYDAAGNRTQVTNVSAQNPPNAFKWTLTSGTCVQSSTVFCWGNAATVW